MKTHDGFYLKQALPALSLTVIVFMLPIGAVFLRAFSDVRALSETFTDPYTWRLLGFTVWESTLSALISVVLAIPFAVFFSRHTFPGRKALLAMSDAAFAIPSILAVLGFVIYYGNNGLLNNLLSAISNGKWSVKFLYSFKAIILAHVYLNFPVAFSLITSSLSTMSDREENASRLLGVSEAKTFFKVTLPKTWAMILATFSLIFLFCFPSFLIVMTLGGNPRFFTMEAEIYRRTYTDVNPQASASMAIFSFLVMSMLLLVTGYGRDEKKAHRDRHTLKKVQGRTTAKAILSSLLIVLFMAPPLLAILYRAFFTKDGSFTLKAWKDIATKSRTGAGTSIQAIANSIFVALAASFISMKLASSIAIGSVRRNSRLIPLLTSLPMAVGSVTMGLGFAFISAKMPFRNLYTAYTLVTLAHIVGTLPFTIRTILPGARQIPEILPIAAQTLGKSPKEAYRRIEYPLLRPYRKRAFAFAFALSLGEVNATLALSEGKVTTIPILIYKMINQYNYQAASALAVILLAVAITVFAIGESEGDAHGLS